MNLKPYLLYADDNGNIFEDPDLYVLGRAAWDAVEIEDTAWIAMPEGGNFYTLEKRRGIGIDVKTGEIKICVKGWAVAAFIPPTFTSLYIAAFESLQNAPTLPLFCYTAVGWKNNTYYVTAVKIENDIRQDCSGYNQTEINKGAKKLLKQYPENRLVKHLVNTCCLTYHCPAARNFSLGRWECPIPSSPACNANCIGCISFQPQEEEIVSTQDRLTFKPSVAEIVEFTVPHLLNAPYPIVSFGQGCEGEPLLMWETIEKAIIEIRTHTNKGSININTNGSMPEAVLKLRKAGLDSIRVSTNSAQKNWYENYYRPNNYVFEDIIESLKIMQKNGGWTSINYFVFSGLTDSAQEYEALRKLIQQTKLHLIQWRNFNIDPDWYLAKMNIAESPERMGIQQMMDLLKEEFPTIQYGYFNPPIERIKGNYTSDFAH